MAPPDGFAALLAWLSDDPVEAQDQLRAAIRTMSAFLRGRGVPPADADDVVQDVVVIAAAKCAGGRPPYPSAEILMMGIAKKMLLQHFRRQGQRREVGLSAEAVEPPAPDLEPETEADCLHAVLDALPASERALLVNYYDGKAADRERLAIALQLDKNALRQRIFRLKQRVEAGLYECLQPPSLRASQPKGAS